MDAVIWQETEEMGAAKFTDEHGSDGTKDGYDIELTRMIQNRWASPIIASEVWVPLNIFMKDLFLKGRCRTRGFHFSLCEFTIAQVKSF